MEKSYSAVQEATKTSVEELDNMRTKLKQIESILSSDKPCLTLVERLNNLRQESTKIKADAEEVLKVMADNSAKLAYKYLDTNLLFNTLVAIENGEPISYEIEDET